MTGCNVARKPVKLTYIHAQKRNATILEGNVALDSQNKVTGNYSFNTHKGTLKYTYVHASGTTLEPSYDFQTESWHFAALKKVSPHDTARFCFDAHQSTVGLEWTRDSKDFGQFKVPFFLCFHCSSLSWIAIWNITTDFCLYMEERED